MIVTCKHCATRFKLDDRLLKPSGTKVRCSSCKSVFRVFTHPGKPAPERSAVAEAGLGAASQLYGLAKGEPRGSGLETDGVDAPDQSHDFDSVDSLDMEDIMRSLEIEDAPVEEVVSDIDIGSFDLLADDSAKAPDDGKGDFPNALARAVDDLDPAEIEALLDMEIPVDSLRKGPPDGEIPAGEEKEAGGTDFSRAKDGMQAVETDGPDDLNIDQLAKMIDGEQLSLFEPALGDTTDDAGGIATSSEGEGLGDVNPSASESTAESADITDTIDLADIELLLDQEITTEKADEKMPFMADETDASDLNGYLDLEENATQPPAEENDVDKVTFDLTDLEQMIEEGADERQDLELEAPSSESAAGTEENALDFSDIEQFLEEEVEAHTPVEKEEPQDLELVLDFPVAEKARGSEAESDFAGRSPENGMPGDAFAASDEPPSDVFPESEIFDLDLDLEDIPEEFSGASVILEGEDGLELETLTSFGEKETVAAEAGPRVMPKSYHPALESDANIFEMGGNDDDIFLPEKMGAESAVIGIPKPKIRKAKKVRAPFWILLILVLIGGGFAAFKLLDQVDIRIPFDFRSIPLVDRFFDKKPADPGTLLVGLTDVNSRFVTNSKAGILFVVTGRARNGYDHPRSYFEVKGAISTQGGKPVKTQKVYCGNILSEKDLADLDLAAIQMRLNNRAGANRSNLKVPRDRTVPFMLVFSDLPTDLGEFALEPAGSAPAN